MGWNRKLSVFSLHLHAFRTFMASVPPPALILQGDMLYQAETERCTSVVFLFSWHVIPLVFGMGEGRGFSPPPHSLIY
jgi:hypothetical protein